MILSRWRQYEQESVVHVDHAAAADDRRTSPTLSRTARAAIAPTDDAQLVAALAAVIVAARRGAWRRRGPAPRFFRALRRRLSSRRLRAIRPAAADRSPRTSASADCGRFFAAAGPKRSPTPRRDFARGTTSVAQPSHAEHGLSETVAPRSAAPLVCRARASLLRPPWPTGSSYVAHSPL